MNSKSVLISDIHFSLKNLEPASKSLIKAFDYAREHSLPLIIAGDIHDSKALIRAECSNALIKIFLEYHDVKSYVLIGNHCKLHEKSDEHALMFLCPYTTVIKAPYYDSYLNLGFIPYQGDNEKFIGALSLFQPGDTLVVHQGFMGASMGEYVKDDSSVNPELVSAFRVISGHYHKHQNIGTVTYIGTPYTITFAEANDGPKGFQILYSDGSLELVPTNLRKHMIVERAINTVLDPIEGLKSNDLLWLKVSGTDSELAALNKKLVGITHLGHQNFKLDKISTSTQSTSIDVSKMTSFQAFDTIIDNENETKDQKQYLRQLWRELVE